MFEKNIAFSVSEYWSSNEKTRFIRFCM